MAENAPENIPIFLFCFDFWKHSSDSGSGWARTRTLRSSRFTLSFVPEIGHFEAECKVFHCFCHTALL